MITQWIAKIEVMLPFPAVFAAWGQVLTSSFLAPACLAQPAFTFVALPETCVVPPQALADLRRRQARADGPTL